MTRILGLPLLLLASAALAVPPVTIAGTITVDGMPIADDVDVRFIVVGENTDIDIDIDITDDTTQIGADFAADLDAAGNIPWGSDLSLRVVIGDVTLELPIGAVGAAAVAGRLDDSARINWTNLNGVPLPLSELAEGNVGDGLRVQNGRLEVFGLNPNMFTNDSIGASALAPDSVGDSELASRSVGASELIDDAVTEAALADNSVRSNHIADGQVGRDDLDSNSVDGSKIINGSIVRSDIEDSAIDGSKVANGSIALEDLSNNSVTTDNIVDGTVSAADLDDGSVDSTAIADGSIADADLDNDSVNSSKITDGTIVAADIANGAITGPKVSGPPILVFSVLNPACTNFGSITTTRVCSSKVCSVVIAGLRFSACGNNACNLASSAECSIAANNGNVADGAAVGILVPRP